MFSWIDMNSTDPAAAKAFYSGVFGWQSIDNPLPGGGVYTMFQLDGHDVAGLGGMPSGTPDYVPSHWNSYITVEDVDEMSAKVSRVGWADRNASYGCDDGRSHVCGR